MNVVNKFRDKYKIFLDEDCANSIFVALKVSNDIKGISWWTESATFSKIMYFIDNKIENNIFKRNHEEIHLLSFGE